MIIFCELQLEFGFGCTGNVKQYYRHIIKTIKIEKQENINSFKKDNKFLKMFGKSKKQNTNIKKENPMILTGTEEKLLEHLEKNLVSFPFIYNGSLFTSKGLLNIKYSMLKLWRNNNKLNEFLKLKEFQGIKELSPEIIIETDNLSNLVRIDIDSAQLVFSTVFAVFFSTIFFLEQSWFGVPLNYYGIVGSILFNAGKLILKFEGYRFTKEFSFNIFIGFISNLGGLGVFLQPAEFLEFIKKRTINFETIVKLLKVLGLIFKLHDTFYILISYDSISKSISISIILILKKAVQQTINQGIVEGSPIIPDTSRSIYL